MMDVITYLCWDLNSMLVKGVPVHKCAMYTSGKRYGITLTEEPFLSTQNTNLFWYSVDDKSLGIIISVSLLLMLIPGVDPNNTSLNEQPLTAKEVLKR